MKKSSVVKLSDLLGTIHDKFGVDQRKVHLLRMVVDCWNIKRDLKITDLLELYEGASRATTHKAIKELVSSKLLAAHINPDDRRVTYLTRGAKFSAYEKILENGL